MICPKCNNENSENASFCVNCGTNLIKKETNKNNRKKTVTKENVKENLTDTFKYVVEVVKTPVKAYKEKEQIYAEPKNVAILTSIIAGFLTIFNLITTVFSSMFVKTFDFSTMKYKTSFSIEALKSINYIELIFKYFLGISIGIVLIATVYYVICYLFKKSANFIKIVAITATSTIPTAIGCMILPVILVKIWSPLAIASSIIGSCYSLLILYNLIETQIKFKNQDIKIYYYLSCMSTLGIATSLILYKFITSNIASGLKGITSILG